MPFHYTFTTYLAFGTYSVATLQVSTKYYSFNNIRKEACQVYIIVNSGGNSLFPVGGQSLLNFRQNFQISDIPPPPFALEKTVFSPLFYQNFRKFVNFLEGGGAASPRPTKISATDREINILSRVFKRFLRTCSFNDVNGRGGGGGAYAPKPDSINDASPRLDGNNGYI